MLEKLSPEMIAKQVQLEAGLMGDRTYRALCDVAGREMEFVGADGSAVLVAMVGGWQDYEKSKPNLEFQWGAEKFFNEGYWKDSSTWPWKTETTKPPRRRGRSAMEELERTLEIRGAA